MTHDAMLKDLLELGSSDFKLTDDEIDFVDDLDRAVIAGKAMTALQMETLTKLHKMACVDKRRPTWGHPRR